MSTVNEYNARKRQLVLMDWSNDSGAIDLKMEGSVLEKNNLLRCWDFSSWLAWGYYIVSIAKTIFKKIEALIHSMKSFSPEVALYLCESIM